MKPEGSLEICILAGGLSRRMGRDKARLKIGRRTMLSEVCAVAKSLGLPVRVIRKDVVARCGPLGGIYTALKTTRAEAVMFLACDMPFIKEGLLRRVRKSFGRRGQALFIRSADGPGFPFMLPREALATVRGQMERKEFAVHRLARRLKAKELNVPAIWHAQLRNINTREELMAARQILRQPASSAVS